MSMVNVNAINVGLNAINVDLNAINDEPRQIKERDTQSQQINELIIDIEEANIKANAKKDDDDDDADKWHKKLDEIGRLLD